MYDTVTGVRLPVVCRIVYTLHSLDEWPPSEKYSNAIFENNR